MGGRNLVVLAVAIGLGLIAVLIANAYFSGMEERQERVAQENRLARIVVASRDLAFGTPLTAENVRMQNWPAQSVPQGAFHKIEDALKNGRVALRPIVPGEPVLADKVSGTGGRAVLSANLPDGMRAVAVSVTQVTGVAGFVRPGDAVDVILTRKIPGEGAGEQDLMSDVILENVPVLAVDQEANEKETAPKVGKTATLQVDLMGAQKLALAERIGQLSLALRNVESQTPEGGSTVTVRDLAKARLYIPARGGQRAPAMAGYSVPSAAFAGAIAPARPSGPVMAVFRGVERSEYEIGGLGGK